MVWPTTASKSKSIHEASERSLARPHKPSAQPGARSSLAYVAAIILLVSPQLSAAPANEAAPTRPNVILILADDLALGDLRGGDGKPTRTPNLDRLADESVCFLRAYSASCVCAPARAALLTGRYPHRTGVVTLNMNKYPKLTRLQLDEVTIAKRLQAAGYVTGLVGKWHVGQGADYHPLARGFDEFEGFSGSQDLSYFAYALDVKHKTLEVKDKYLTDDLSARAIAFVRRHHKRRFFLHLAHYAPHRPLEAPPKLVQRYREQGFDQQVATIYAMIEVMDRGIGELLEELKRLHLDENTVVIFASDNGPDPLTGVRFNHGLRGAKYQIYEGGIRVPLFIRWPQQFSPGKRKQLVHFVDVAATILDVCGVAATAPPMLDGTSFASVLRNHSARFAPVRYWQWNRGRPNYTHNAAVREGRLKLVRPFVTRGLRVVDSNLPAALYDMEAEPGETRDISHQLPREAATLAAKLASWSKDVEQERVRARQVRAKR